MGKKASATPSEVAPVPGFFGHVVAPGRPLKWANEVEEFCMQLNSAALGADATAGRSTLSVVAKTSKIALCTLTPQVAEQWNLTQTFTPMDGDIEFVVDGPNAIHLTGFIEVQDDEDDDEDDEDEEDMMVFEGGESSEEEEEEEKQQKEAKDRFQVLEEVFHGKDTSAKKAKSPKKEAVKTPEKPAKKVVAKTDEKDAAQKKAKAAAKKEKEQKVADKIAELTAAGKSSKKRAAPAESVEVPKKAKTTTRVHKGVNIEEIAVGKGRPVQRGRKVSILYRGRLTNGKQFDSAQNRKKPFTFRHGIGDVIKGMDIGIEGMCAGGKRTITIPSRLGYGRSGAPPTIPGNADLIFEIEVL